MSGYNFTDRVRRALQLAREEATRLHHQYVGPEHILLGLIRDGEGVATRVLTGLNVDLEALRQKIEDTVKPGAAGAAGPDLPYTSRGKRILELAMTEARELNHAYVLNLLKTWLLPVGFMGLALWLGLLTGLAVLPTSMASKKIFASRDTGAMRPSGYFASVGSSVPMRTSGASRLPCHSPKPRM